MLEVQNAKKYFGGVKAVDNVSIQVKKSSITGLIGANGAGKTTLFNMISGFIPLTAGTVIYEGEDITNQPAYKISTKGIVRTFQTPLGFPRMTVMENMLVFAKNRNAGIFTAIKTSKKVTPLEEEYIERARKILKDVGLGNKEDAWVSDLSAGELKILEFARPLMADPHIFLLDEPAAGINPANLNSLVTLIKDLRNKGYTFLIVDHNLKFIMNICDYIYVMADGKLIFEGLPDEVANADCVIESYIGKKKTEDTVSN